MRRKFDAVLLQISAYNDGQLWNYHTHKQFLLIVIYAPGVEIYIFWWNKFFTKIMLKYVLHKRELVSIYSTVCRYYIYRQFYPYLVKYKPCFKQWHPSISPFWFQLLFWFQVGNSNNAACYNFKLRKICIEHAKFTNSIESYLWNWPKALE